MDPPRILFIDAHDSFSNNIISLLETSLHISVSKISIDAALPLEHLRSFAAIVIGPGPGNPSNARDIGCIKDVWTPRDEDLLPVLGVCLGFQSLVLAFGGEVLQLTYPRHGIETRVWSRGESIFKGAEEFDTVQYHSLRATLGNGDSGEDGLWKPSPVCPDLVPLAWDIDHAFSRSPPTPDDGRGSDEARNPRNVLMGVRHASLPFFGIQFHPESICSSAGARKVVSNWWDAAKDWNQMHRPDLELGLGIQLDCSAASRSTEHSAAPSMRSATGGNPAIHPNGSTQQYESKVIDIGSLTVPAIHELLRLRDSNDQEGIVLDSEMRQMPHVGRFSIIGLVLPDTLKISYTIGSGNVVLEEGENKWSQSLKESSGSVFSFLRDFMEQHTHHSRGQASPFMGGLMGYIDYEACLETIELHAAHHSDRPNICFAYVERSVVVDHSEQRVVIQSIKRGDQEWIKDTAAMLCNHTSFYFNRSESTTSLASTTSGLTPKEPASSNISTHCSSFTASSLTDTSAKIAPPLETEYRSKIRSCQTEIRLGNAYELCLTDQTSVHLSPLSPSSWSQYLRLRSINPAPFGAYLRLGPLTLLSSSPERFMAWTRPDASNCSTCQFRPIKGTVKKRHENPDGSIGFVDLETATALLSSPKERAENLMIVDLIRHDLAGVVGSGNVETKSLMKVEEYESVYQLVTVIEGTLRPPTPSQPSDQGDGYTHPAKQRRTGIDMLSASLPPGSMTGAPKQRACELLREIENHQPRSGYSGVLGYMDVAGGGDFSVVIRTAYRWDDEVGEHGETWRIGAGGAVTDMSEEVGEWEEMEAKLECALGLFRSG